jgi:hypothetical protein
MSSHQSRNRQSTHPPCKQISEDQRGHYSLYSAQCLLLVPIDSHSSTMSGRHWHGFSHPHQALLRQGFPLKRKLRRRGPIVCPHCYERKVSLSHRTSYNSQSHTKPPVSRFIAMVVGSYESLGRLKNRHTCSKRATYQMRPWNHG